MLKICCVGGYRFTKNKNLKIFFFSHTIYGFNWVEFYLSNILETFLEVRKIVASPFLFYKPLIIT